MPAHTDLSSALERLLLLQLGERLKSARLSRGMASTNLAQKVGISRTTLHAVESGEPTPTIGTYLRVMSALGLAGDLALVASDAARIQPDTNSRLRAARVKPSAQRVVVKVDSSRHIAQDLQSLMLHKEAVRLIRQDPELVKRAFETLARWRSGGYSHSQPLWDEWAVILHRRDWRRALSNTRRAQELRQASPLSTLVPQETRLRIIADVRKLKRGIDVSGLPRLPGSAKSIDPAVSRPRLRRSTPPASSAQ